MLFPFFPFFLPALLAFCFGGCLVAFCLQFGCLQNCGFGHPGLIGNFLQIGFTTMASIALVPFMYLSGYVGFKGFQFGGLAFGGAGTWHGGTWCDANSHTFHRGLTWTFYMGRYVQFRHLACPKNCQVQNSTIVIKFCNDKSLFGLWVPMRLEIRTEQVQRQSFWIYVYILYVYTLYIYI